MSAATTAVRSSSTTIGGIEYKLTGLSTNITYYYRAFAYKNGASGDKVYGTVKTFTTDKVPVVLTKDIADKDITQTTAILKGRLDTVPGNRKSVQYGFEYWKSGSSRQSATTVGVSSSSYAKDLSFKVLNLSPNTKYNYVAFYYEGATKKFGEEKSFTTKQEPLKVTTNGYDINKVNNKNQVILYGKLDQVPSGMNVVHGFICGTSAKLDSNTYGVYPIPNTSKTPGIFSCIMTDGRILEKGTTYYYQAVAYEEGNHVTSTWSRGTIKSFKIE